ncbi:hypothetical protein NDU88_001887 [Pleurodeles waltl]|uniref:Uncharacterized protein n=1 Tax=Pleurodeles waltl TaxID=8319 RepID=A0AAV7LYX9_PLEWA|nr:hypothetical protein NDU88_001887 [Pleurodeles waltl]
MFAKLSISANTVQRYTKGFFNVFSMVKFKNLSVGLPVLIACGKVTNFTRGHRREGTIARQADLARNYNVTLSAQRCEEEVRPRQRGVAPQLK